MMLKPSLLVAVCSVVVMLGASHATAETKAETLRVFVSIPPEAYLVERVGGKHVDVQVLVASGQDPHTFEPTPQQVMALGRARLYFKVGMPFEERLLQKIGSAQASLTIVDIAEGVAKRKMVAYDHHEGHDADQHAGHQHDTEAEDKGNDPHVWLSPPLLKVQAVSVARALMVADPEHATEYAANLQKLLKNLEDTHARIQEALAPYRGRTFYVFHPAFGYFADAYGLRQEAVEVEGKSPTPKELGGLVKRAKTEGVEIIFVQPQFDSQSAEVVANAIGGAVVPMDPLAKDILTNLDQMAARIGSALDSAAHGAPSEQQR